MVQVKQSPGSGETNKQVVKQLIKKLLAHSQLDNGMNNVFLKKNSTLHADAPITDNFFHADPLLAQALQIV
jgi:hypothetical protein